MASDLNWFGKGGFAPLDEETGGLPPVAPTSTFRSNRTHTMIDRNKSLNAFLARVGDIRKEMVQVKGKFQDLGHTYEDSFGAATTEQIKTFKADLEATMQEIKQVTKRLLTNVKNLQQEVTDAEKDPILLRQKQSKTAALEAELTQFRDEVFKFQTRMKDDRRKEYRNKLRNYLNKEPTDAEVDKWAESGDDGALYASLLHDQSRPAVQKVLQEIQERHRAAKALQTSIEELYNLFAEMQILVHAQGDQIRTLAENLESAEEYVSTATKIIHQGAAIKTERQRTKLIIIIVVAVIIAVIVAVVLGTVFGTQPVK